jgi:hypothetical protein
MVLISIRGWINRKVKVQLEGLGQLKKMQWHRKANPRPSGLQHSASTRSWCTCSVRWMFDHLTRNRPFIQDIHNEENPRFYWSGPCISNVLKAGLYHPRAHRVAITKTESMASGFGLYRESLQLPSLLYLYVHLLRKGGSGEAVLCWILISSEIMLLGYLDISMASLGAGKLGRDTGQDDPCSAEIDAAFRLFYVFCYRLSLVVSGVSGPGGCVVHY